MRATLNDSLPPLEPFETSTVGRRLTLVLLYLLAAVFVVTITSDMYYPVWDHVLGKSVAAISALGLSSLPVLMSIVHATTRDRQINRLETLSFFPVRDTSYYRSAINNIKGIETASLKSDYVIPIMTLFCVTFLFSVALLSSPWFASFFQQKSFVLGGVAVLSLEDNAKIGTFQQGTFLCGMMAFLGSYVYMLGRIWDRINNNDIYPISYHYYAARIIISYFVAIVVRHSLAAFGLADNSLIVILGFVIGLTPDFFILALARKAYQTVKIYGSKSDPAEVHQPSGMPLLMLDDLSRDKIDRLGELGIDSAQVLACQNPLLIWPRLPYDLGLIIDWIAQAQLYVLVREQGLKALRDLCVYDIFDFHLRLANAQARHEICNALHIVEDAAAVIVEQLDADQSFTRLKEVRDALKA
jgi:hypothetical protein